MRLYIIGGALVAFLALSGVVAYQNSTIKAQRAEMAALGRSVAALTVQKEQSAIARDIEEARAEQWQARAAELDASIEALFTGDIPDAPLDPRIADIVNSLPASD